MFGRKETAKVEFQETSKMNFNLTYANGLIFKYEGIVIDAGEVDQDYTHGTWTTVSGPTSESGEWEFFLSGNKFTGWCMNESAGKSDIRQRTSITKKGIFSIGKDDIGIFTIRGDVNVAERTIQFCKNYLKKQSLVFNGRFNLHRGEMIIRGIYDYRDLSNRKIVVPGSEGVFEMRGMFGHSKPLDAKEGEILWDEWKGKMLELEVEQG